MITLKINNQQTINMEQTETDGKVKVTTLNNKNEIQEQYEIEPHEMVTLLNIAANPKAWEIQL